MDPRISVVIATRDRRVSLDATLGHLGALAEAPRVIVVDNGSGDDTVAHVRSAHPGVRVIALGSNRGAAARTCGVELADTPYVAFSDDDSWWEPGALGRAADLLDAYPRLGLLAAHVLVGPSGRTDPTCLAMAGSPLEARVALPGPSVLGFLACGAVVRRSAYLEVGGFEARFGVGGEEELLAIDLASRGWGLAYAEQVVARHVPGASGPRPGRRRIQSRNALWSTWLRRPLSTVLRRTARLAGDAVRDPAARAALGDALIGLPWVIRGRRPIPPEVERDLARLGH